MSELGYPKLRRPKPNIIGLDAAVAYLELFNPVAKGQVRQSIIDSVDKHMADPKTVAVSTLGYRITRWDNDFEVYVDPELWLKSTKETPRPRRTSRSQRPLSNSNLSSKGNIHHGL